MEVTCGMQKTQTTIREWLTNLCKGKPLESVIEGIKVYTSKQPITNTYDEVKFIGEEVFTLTNNTFVTDNKLLEYVDKPLSYVANMGIGGIGLDGEGNMRKWVGVAFYVLD